MNEKNDSLLEIAFEEMKKKKKPKTLEKICKDVFEIKGIKYNEETASQFQIDFMLSGNFVCCGEDKDGEKLWDLKSRQSSSLLDIEPVGISVLKDIWDLTYGFIGQQFIEPSYDRLEGDEKPKNYTDFYYNSRKEGLYNYGDSKAERKFWRMFPYYRSKYVFENPYDAAAAFEYGKKVK